MQGFIQEDERKSREASVFLGSYIPFTGVKYYSLFDEQAIREGKNRTGTVGWRLSRTSAESIAKAPNPNTIEKTNALNYQILKGVDIFQNLDDEQIKRLGTFAQIVSVPSGELLGRAGELVSQLFIIIEGKAELSAHSGIGPITIRVAGPGESFPLAILIGSGTLITSVMATTEMKLLTIPRSRLLALCSDDTGLGMRIFRNIAELLGDRYQKTLSHLTATTERVLKKADYFVNV